MFNLVYKSKTNPVFGPGQIQDMLEKARKYNSKHRITGCLLLYKGEFLQYLEGQENHVLRLFEKIQKDERHFDVIQLSQSFIYQREFPDWPMAFEDFLGTNRQLEHLKILSSAFIALHEQDMNPRQSTKSFWVTARKLLKSKNNQMGV